MSTTYREYLALLTEAMFTPIEDSAEIDAKVDQVEAECPEYVERFKNDWEL